VSSPSTTGTPAKRRRFDRLALIGTIAGVLSVIIAAGAWWWPQSPSSGAGGTAAGPPVASAAAATTAPAGTSRTSGPAAVQVPAYLDTWGIAAESGLDYLVPLPRAVKDQAGYTSHPIAISCPSNQAGDQAHDVTYVLRGRFYQFDAEVHPWYPPGPDSGSATYVTVIGAINQTDGQLVTKEAGSQKTAFLNAPKPISAVIDGAEKLTLHVQCGNPNGVIVLTNARLTP
jgi:hypothetical protein